MLKVRHQGGMILNKAVFMTSQRKLASPLAWDPQIESLSSWHSYATSWRYCSFGFWPRAWHSHSTWDSSRLMLSKTSMSSKTFKLSSWKFICEVDLSEQACVRESFPSMRRLLSLREPVHNDLVVVPDAAFVLVNCHRLLHMWSLLRQFVGSRRGFEVIFCYGEIAGAHWRCLQADWCANEQLHQ